MDDDGKASGELEDLHNACKDLVEAVIVESGLRKILDRFLSIYTWLKSMAEKEKTDAR